MTSIALAGAYAPARSSIDRATGLLLLAFVAAVPLSIAVAQTILSLALVCWAAGLVRDRTAPAAPPFFLALAAYAAVTIVSAIFSSDVAASLLDSRQLILFLIVPLVYDVARGPRSAAVVTVVLAAGAAAAAYGVVQFGLLGYDHLGRRPTGTLSHYMTYSGVLMLVLCAAVARILFSAQRRVWPAIVATAIVTALVLSFTRSAWVGACVAAGLLFTLRDLRLVAVLPVVVAAVFAVAPDRVAGRMTSMFELADPTVRDRVAMLRAGTAMVAAHPILGVGPDRVSFHYPQYRDPTAVEPVQVHLHNVPLQIAAERGLAALAVWLAFVGMLAAGLVRLFRTARDRTLPALGLAATAAMAAAGFFEYNFGDSEFLMLYLVLVTLPFAAARPGDAAAADRP